jgi:CheY-like chemotaxis protein
MKTRLNILIVDDDRRMTGTLADILEIQGYQTTQVNTGQEALERIRSASFDCALTDVKMPGMDGVELIRELRKLQPGLPIVLMTAYAADEMLQRGLEEGAVGVLNKPLDMHQVLGFLAALSREQLITIVDDDPDFCATLADILERRGFRVDKVNDPHLDVDKMVGSTQILLLDMKLNAINGFDLLKTVHARYPDLPVLLVTGYRQEMTGAIQNALEISAYTCLYKPLVLSELLGKLSEIQAVRWKALFEE